ncbi:MAG: hypothetical protein VB143_06630 [Burkholderia sp.]
MPVVAVPIGKLIEAIHRRPSIAGQIADRRLAEPSIASKSGRFFGWARTFGKMKISPISYLG